MEGLGTGTLEEGPQPYCLCLCCINPPTMLLADHSWPFLGKFKDSRQSFGSAGTGSWLSTQGLLFSCQETAHPLAQWGSRTASPVCAVLGTSLGNTFLSLIPGEENDLLEASSIAELGLGALVDSSWLKDGLICENADASNPNIIVPVVCCPVGLPPAGLCAACPRPDQMRLKWLLLTATRQMCTQRRWACSKLRCSPWARAARSGHWSACAPRKALGPSWGYISFTRVVVGVASTPFATATWALAPDFSEGSEEWWRSTESVNSLDETSCLLWGQTQSAQIR